MAEKRNHTLARCGLALTLGMAVIAASAAPPNKATRANKQTRPTRPANKNAARLVQQQPAPETLSVSADTELWLFGVSEVKRMKPFDARGMRTIIDLRTIDPKSAISFLDKMARSDMGVAICIRWKNPDHSGDQPRGKENFDVPPTPEESAAALSALTEVLTSAPARKIGKRLYIQIYNEIGGGPGTFGIDDVPGMFEFADAAVPVIRSASPEARICGPALSGGQLAFYGSEPKTEGKLLKSEQIERWMVWTAHNADVADVHLNGLDVDAQWANTALGNMRQILDERGGHNVGLVSFEWSCSGYPDRDDDPGVANYIHDLWAVLKGHNVQAAAYTYWPLLDRPEEVRAKTSWASVIGDNMKPNRVVADALVEIGKAQ